MIDSVIRPVRGLTAAEAAVIDAATRVVDGAADLHPYLTRAVNALRHERQNVISNQEFHARMLALAPTARPARALRRSGWTAYELMFELTADDVMATCKTGWHTWAVWYLTCEQFGVEPPWVTELRSKREFCEQVEHERARLRRAEAGHA